MKKERTENEGLVRLVGVVAIDRPAEMELVRQKFSPMDTILVETEGFWSAMDCDDDVLAVVADSRGIITRRLYDTGVNE